MKRSFGTTMRTVAATTAASAVVFAYRQFCLMPTRFPDVDLPSTPRHVQAWPSAIDTRGGLPSHTGALRNPKRMQSSSSSASSGHSSGSTKVKRDEEGGPNAQEQEIIDRARPSSPTLEERLGFVAGQVITEELLRDHFVVLAKYYHPDSAFAPADSADAFPNIKEAYDALLKEVKGGRTRVSHAGGGYTTTEGAGPRYADEAQRQARMRALGDGVMFFLLVTFVYIMMIATHNRDRLKSRYLLHFLGIFFIIQLFPRLLAAAVLFAMHTGYLVKNGELSEQAATLLVVDRRDKDLGVQVEGIKSDAAEHTVVQVEIIVAPGQAQCTNTTASGTTSLVSGATTTLTMDPGVTCLSVPLPPKGQEAHTTYKVKAVDEKRKFVVCEKEFSLA